MREGAVEPSPLALLFGAGPDAIARMTAGVAEEAPERLWGLGRPCPGESELLAELFAS
jgi:hypothetical protein